MFKGLLFVTFGVSIGLFIGAQMKISDHSGKEVKYSSLSISSDTVKFLDHKLFEINNQGVNLFDSIRITFLNKN